MFYHIYELIASNEHLNEQHTRCQFNGSPHKLILFFSDNFSHNQHLVSSSIMIYVPALALIIYIEDSVFSKEYMPDTI